MLQFAHVVIDTDTPNAYHHMKLLCFHHFVGKPKKWWIDSLIFFDHWVEWLYLHASKYLKWKCLWIWAKHWNTHSWGKPFLWDTGFVGEDPSLELPLPQCQTSCCQSPGAFQVGSIDFWDSETSLWTTKWSNAMKSLHWFCGKDVEVFNQMSARKNPQPPSNLKAENEAAETCVPEKAKHQSHKQRMQKNILPKTKTVNLQKKIKWKNNIHILPPPLHTFHPG